MLWHPLDGAFERINRAGEHLKELELAVLDFTQDVHDAVVVQFEGNPPHKPIFHTPQLLPPPRLKILIGEICNNLRSALDYLVYELARLDSGAIQDGTQFPIEDTPTAFQKASKNRLKGINASHVAAIEKSQPYNGCHWTKVLKDISNPDKHRHLTITSHGGWITIDPPGSTLPSTHVPPISSIRRVVLPDGIEVTVQLTTCFAVMVPMEQPVGFPAALTVQGTLQQLKAEVAHLLQAFKPEFK
jgi:hypothetical protein